LENKEIKFQKEKNQQLQVGKYKSYRLKIKVDKKVFNKKEKFEINQEAISSDLFSSDISTVEVCESSSLQMYLLSDVK